MGDRVGRSIGFVLCLLCSVPALAGATERTTAARFTRWEGDLPRSIVAPLDGALSAPHAGTPESAARAFLRDERELFGLSERDLADLELTSSVRGPAGSTHLYFRQTIGGIEVYQGRINLTLRVDGAVLYVGSRLFPGLSAAGEPALSRGAAERRAAYELGAPADKPPRSRLVVVPQDSSSRLAWEVRLAAKNGDDTLLLVDADDGAVLDRSSLVFYGSARVLNATKPNPETEEWAPAEHQLLPIPAGWLAGAGTNLSGNNASSHLFDPSDPGLSSPTAAYDYPFNTPQSALVNAWYWVNWAHDRFYALGFDEQAGNFQTNNFGLGGLGGDAVRVYEAIEGYRAYPTASFTATVDGIAPTLTVPWESVCRICADHNGEIDDGGDRSEAFMRDIILHEYAHGVTTRRVGGPADATCLTGPVPGQPMALAEGWSDLFAMSFFNEPRLGEYFTEGFGWIHDPRHDLHYGEFGRIGDTGNNHASNGQIWNGALWELRQSMVALDPLNGLEQFHQLIVEALALTPCHPTFLDARDAILAADTLLYGSAHHRPIWNVFAARGMGQTATTTGPNDSAPVAGFTTPAALACAPPPAPAGLVATATNANKVGLIYSAAGAAAVEVWRDDLNNPADAPEQIATTTSMTTFNDTTVQGGKSYRYHLVALGSGGTVCRSGLSTTSDVVATGSCNATYPIFVPNLTVTDTGNASCGLTISWQPAQPACPGSGAPIVYNVYRSPANSALEGNLAANDYYPYVEGGDTGTPGFVPSDYMLLARTTGTSIVDVPPGTDVVPDPTYPTGQFFFDDGAYYIVTAQHGTLGDPPDHRDRGSSQVMQWATAIPTLGRTPFLSWNFDSGAQGWSLSNHSASPLNDWTVVDPSATSWGNTWDAPGDAAGGSGMAWVTGDAGGGPSTASSHSCEDGSYVRSPSFDGTGGATLLSYDYWSQQDGYSELFHSLALSASGNTTYEAGMLTTQRFRGPARYGWQRAEIDLKRFGTPTTTMYFYFNGVRCGFLDEFGIDNVRIDRGTVCQRSNLKLDGATIDDASTGLGDGDGRLEPGETARVAMSLLNDGGATATTPTGFLAPKSIGAAVLDAHATFPSIASTAKATSTGDGFLVSLPATADCLGSTTFELQLNDATGESAKVLWSVPNDNDEDGLCAAVDNCPNAENRNQADGDADTVGNACDNCPTIMNTNQADTDLDTVGEACDNCPDVANANQANTDGDSAGNVCDCAPTNPALARIPQGITGQRFTSKTHMAWDANADAATYGVHVGTIAAGDPFSYTHVCDPSLASTVPETNDPVMPTPGELRYYLVSGANGCGEGGVGTDSAGNPRPYFPCGEGAPEN
jgi:hypothetical protein